MGKHARIEPGGYVTIDVPAWLDQRTGGPDDDLTHDLQSWAASHHDDGTQTTTTDPAPSRQDWVPVTRAWCTHRGHTPPDPDPGLIAHTESRLDAEIWILRATVGRTYRVAVVGINHDPPIVYSDACTDSWDWYDADSVDITCPNGHGWTWRTGRELITPDGSFTTLTVIFGPTLDAPFTPNPTHPHDPDRHDGDGHGHDGHDPTCSIPASSTLRNNGTCPCLRTPWILCPTCGSRCDVELPTH